MSDLEQRFEQAIRDRNDERASYDRQIKAQQEEIIALNAEIRRLTQLARTIYSTIELAGVLE